MVKKSISLALIGISLLSISGCASSQTRNVAASSFGDPISHPNACVAESLHPQIENELAVLGDLAACPEGEGFRLVPSTLPAQAVFLGYSAKHPLFLKQIIPILARSPASSQINFFVKHAEIGEARKFLSEIPDAQSLHFLELPFEPAWPQDFIVMGITGKNPPKPTLLNLPYEHAPKLPEAVAHACNISQVAPKFPASEIKENNDFGGNIVPFPGNVVVIGSGVTPTAKSALAKGHHIIEVNTEGAKGWQPPSMHVDEIFTVIANGRGGHCGFKVIYASPGKALAIMADAKTPIVVQSDRPGTISNPAWNPANCLSKMRSDGTKVQSDKALACHSFVAANQEIESIVQSYVKKVTTGITAATQCSNIETVGVPALFTPYGDPTKADHYSLGYTVSMNSNPVNSLILGSMVIAPEQPNEFFSGAVREAFESGGSKVEFVTATELSQDLGGVHCATNVVRACRP